MLVSKIQTYVSHKMHLKKVITKNMLNKDLHQKWRVFCNNFFRLRLYFWNQHKILRFLIPVMTYFRNFFYLYYRMTKLSGAFPKRFWERKKIFSMLVQDSQPIDTTISKWESLIIKIFSKSTHPTVQAVLLFLFPHNHIPAC
jgi:hypothetical protein